MADRSTNRLPNIDDTNIRQFWITSTNDDDVMIDLMDYDTFGTDPSGMGAKASNTSSYADQDVIISEYALDYSEITFTVVTGASSHKPYAVVRKNIVKQLNKRGLVLHYECGEGLDKVTYIRDVSFISLEKTEMNENGVLGVKLTLKPLTPWYNWVEVYNYSTGAQWIDGEKDQISSVITSKSLSISTDDLIPFDTFDCVHFIPDITVPIKLRWKTSGSYVTFEMRIYDAAMSVVSNAKYTANLTDSEPYFLFSSDFREPYAVRSADGQNGTYDVMSTMSTDSSGLMRAPINERLYIYLGPAGIQSLHEAAVQVREEAVMI